MAPISRSSTPDVNTLDSCGSGFGWVLYVSSGLGGMSGAQAKAVEIAGGIGILAEVDYSRIETRHNQLGQ